MSYLCHSCSAKRGYLQSVQTMSILATGYQLGKYMKHTVPDPSLNLQSVFDSASTQAYEQYIVSSALSGSVEIDSQGRRNVIWVAGTPVGFQYRNGVLQFPQDAVKVVLSTDSGAIHAYPQSTTQFRVIPCADCGSPVPF